MNISHLPADLRKGIEDYDRRVDDGEITFDPSGYAHDPYPDSWIAGFLAAHLPPSER
jgi:hypothetical protein